MKICSLIKLHDILTLSILKEKVMNQLITMRFHLQVFRVRETCRGRYSHCDHDCSLFSALQDQSFHPSPINIKRKIEIVNLHIRMSKALQTLREINKLCHMSQRP